MFIVLYYAYMIINIKQIEYLKKSNKPEDKALLELLEKELIRWYFANS